MRSRILADPVLDMGTASLHSTCGQHLRIKCAALAYVDRPMIVTAPAGATAAVRRAQLQLSIRVSYVHKPSRLGLAINSVDTLDSQGLSAACDIIGHAPCA